MSSFTETAEYKAAFVANWTTNLNASNPDRALSAGYWVDVGGQKVAVRITVPFSESSENGRVILKLSPWSNGVNDDVDVAEAVALAAGGARVISLSPPGIDKGTSGLNRRQRRALRRGDFSEVAKLQIGAANKAYCAAFLQDMPEDLYVWGSSQGGANAVVVAEQLRLAGANVRRLIVGSTPVHERRVAKLALEYFKDAPNTLRLLGQFALPWREPGDRDIYKKTMPAFIKRMVMRPIAHIWPGLALAKGLEYARILDFAQRNPNTGVDFWVGENDPISPKEEWWRLTDAINKSRVGQWATTQVLQDMPHGVTSDPTAILVVASRMHL